MIIRLSGCSGTVVLVNCQNRDGPEGDVMLQRTTESLRGLS